MEESWREGRRHAVECDLKSREAMEAAAHAPPSSARAGSPLGTGAHGVAKPQGLLADEPELIRTARPRSSPCGLRFAASNRPPLRRPISLVRMALSNRWMEEHGVPDRIASRDSGLETREA